MPLSKMCLIKSLRKTALSVHHIQNIGWVGCQCCFLDNSYRQRLKKGTMLG